MPGSSALSVRVGAAVICPVGLVGIAPNTMLGGAELSIVQVIVCEGPICPAASVCRRSSVYVPAGRVGVVYGLVQTCQPAGVGGVGVPLNRHSNVLDVSPVNVKLLGVSDVDDGKAPLAGATGGAVSTIHAFVAMGPVLPAASTRRAESVCVPSASVAPPAVYGDVHAPHAPLSNRHSRVLPDVPVMTAENDVDVVAPLGVPVIVGAAVGATVSTTHAVDTEVPALPAASTRRTATVWLPSARAPVAYGEVHAAQVPPSSWHW